MIYYFIPVFFIWALLSIYWMYQYSKGKEVNEHLYASIPNVFTTIGVLGTFLGIYMGLQDFNVDEITSSIPPLLSGLKGAFSTSIIGIILSIIFGRISEYIAGLNSERHIDDDTRLLNMINENLENIFNHQKAIRRLTKEDIASENEKLVYKFNSLNNSINAFKKESIENSIKNTKSTNTAIHELKNKNVDNQKRINKNLLAISNSTENLTVKSTSHFLREKERSKNLTDLIENFKRDILAFQKTNTNTIKNTIGSKVDELNDNQNKNTDKLENKLGELSEILAENNVKALVEVMEKVTIEFNKQMSELINRLVKENFEELNNSVKQLNKWQVENKEMVSDLTDQHKLTTENFKITSEAIKNISNSTDKIIVNTSKITDENSKVKELLNKLEEIMISDTRFEKASKNILDAIDTIKLNIDAFDKTTNRLNQWVEKEKGVKDSTNALLVKLDEVSQIKAYNGEFWKETKKQLNQGVNLVSKTTQNLNANLDNINEEFQNQLREVLVSLDELIQRIIAKYEI